MQWERKKNCILFRKRFQKIALEYNPNFNVTLITKKFEYSYVSNNGQNRCLVVDHQPKVWN